MKSLEELKQIRDEYAAKLAMREHHNDYHVIVGMGTCGIANGARAIINEFANELETNKLYNISLTISGCMGDCSLEPMAEVIDSQGNKIIYIKLTEEAVKEIVKEHLIGGNPVKKYMKENL